MGQLHPTARAPRRARNELPVGVAPEDVEDPEEPAAFHDMVRYAVREQFLETARLEVLQDAISICYKQYGVNHSVVCRPIYIEYLRRLEASYPLRINIPELHPELAKPKDEGHDAHAEQHPAEGEADFE